MRQSLSPQQRLSYTRHPGSALTEFRSHMSTGRDHHNRQQFALAAREFNQARLISQHLIDVDPLPGYQCYLKLKVASCHNLAAAFSGMGKLQHAEAVIRELHQSLLSLCRSEQIPRSLRAHALGALDNALFALTSLLGQQGKLCQLFEVIEETDRTAEQASMQMMH